MPIDTTATTIEISRTVAQLTPNTVSEHNPRSQSSWFSFIRRYSRERRGAVIPVTKTEFTRAWNSMRPDFEFVCSSPASGDIGIVSIDTILNNLKEELKNNVFPEYQRPHRVAETAWVRIILAFNMYAEVRRELGLLPNNRIDFLGSTGNACNIWENRFNGRRVLYVNDNQLIDLVRLIDNGINDEAWQLIFNIYESLYPLPISRSPRRLASRRSRGLQFRTVDSPTHSIAQEYLNRTDDNELDIIPDNQQIANMVLQTNNILPYDLRKMIYETCTALHISHAI